MSQTTTISSILREFNLTPNLVGIVTSASLATITTAGYLTNESDNIASLNNGAFEWQSGDYVLIQYSGGEGWFTYDSTNATFVAAPTSPGSLSDTLASAHIFVGSAGNVATGVAVSGDATLANTGALTIANNAVTSAKVATNLLQYATVSISAAEFNGMYAAPKQIIANAGANTLIVLERAALVMTYGSANFANGGVVAFQYDSTVHGAGVAASNTEAAADFFAAASTSFQFNGVAGDTVAIAPFTSTVNKGIYLSNATGAFDTGDSTFVCHAWYRVIPTV